MRAIRIHETGGVEKLRWDDIPAPDEVRIKVAAVGVNFIGIYQRTGLYSLPLPGVLGMEAAGTVTAVGANVRGLKVGDAVGRLNVRIGAEFPLERAADAQRAFEGRQTTGKVLLVP